MRHTNFRYWRRRKNIFYENCYRGFFYFKENKISRLYKYLLTYIYHVLHAFTVSTGNVLTSRNPVKSLRRVTTILIFLGESRRCRRNGKSNFITTKKICCVIAIINCEMFHLCSIIIYFSRL